MQSLSMSISFVNSENLIASGMIDGQLCSIMADVSERVVRGEKEIKI